MANTQRSTGARPWGEVLRANLYPSSGTVLPGDFVQMSSSGQVVQYSSSANPILGVCGGYSTVQGTPVLVWDHPDQRFVVNSDNTQPASQADLFKNYQISGNTGRASFKVSSMALTGTSKGTVATMPLKALFLDNRPDNVIGTSYCDVVVVINNHLYKGGTGQVGF